MRHVLIHEIGHHFGLSDEDMERIEAVEGEACMSARGGELAGGTAMALNHRDAEIQRLTENKQEYWPRMYADKLR